MAEYTIMLNHHYIFHDRIFVLLSVKYYDEYVFIILTIILCFILFLNKVKKVL